MVQPWECLKFAKPRFYRLLQAGLQCGREENVDTAGSINFSAKICKLIETVTEVAGLHKAPSIRRSGLNSCLITHH